MANNIVTSTSVATMTSLELVEIINSMRGEGSAELLHKNFMAKIERHPGIDSAKYLAQYKDTTGRTLKCYKLPKRESELMVMSESLEVQAMVYDRMTELERQAAAQQQIAKPVSEKPTPLPSATAAFKSMHSLAKLVGLSGNQAILSANNAVFKYHGVNCLNLLDHQALTAEDQRGRTYTATGLGNEFLGMSGKCGAKVNKMLEAGGLITREQVTGRPIPTDAGEKHGEWADTGKSHGGAPIKEWRWFSSVVDLIQPIAA